MSMFMGSTMKKILDITEAVAEYKMVDSCYRNPFIKAILSETSYDTRFEVFVGEINWNGEYKLIFNSRGQLLKAYEVRWGVDGESINMEPIQLPVDIDSEEEA